MWLGKDDPAKSIENSGHDDPERNALAAVLTAWRAAIGDGSITVKELRARLASEDDLRDAISEVAPGKDGNIDGERLGKWLRRMNDRIAGGLLLSQGPRNTHRQKTSWRVSNCTPSPPFAPVPHSTRNRFGIVITKKDIRGAEKGV
jgi:hypothetical protein